MTYRREIDGLRAVAVLAVLLYHAGLGVLPGGYLGVDVFFVISGYLITSLILADQAAGRFTLAGFWERRVRRIFPLLTVVALATIPLGWALLPAQDAEDFAQSLLAIGLSLSNMLFWREGAYFGPSGEFKPLLNTWSLGVEAQFYLAFPLVCLLIARLGGQAATRKVLAVLALAGLAASFALSQMLYAFDGNGAYFLLPTRAWQLLLGTLCALLPQQLAGRAKVGALAREVGALAGAVLLVAAFAVLGVEYEAGGYGTLAAAGGTALLIACAGPGNIVGRLLGARAVVAVGLISYGAYLWHFPLLSFSRHYLTLSADPELERFIILPPALALGLCTLSLGLAALTWRWIEQPFRNRQAMPWRKLVLLLGLGWAIIVAAAGTMLATDWQQRFYLHRVLGATAAQTERLIDVRQLTDTSLFDSFTLDDGACIFATSRVETLDWARIDACHARYGPGLLLLGDSHAQDVHNVIVRLASERAFVVSLVDPGCRIVEEGCFYPAIAAELTTARGAVFARIAYAQAGSALILDALDNPDSQQAFISPQTARLDAAAIRAIARVLAQLQADSGKPVVLVGSIYEPRINFETNQPLRSGWVPRPTVRQQFGQLDRQMQSSAEHAGIGYISLHVGPLAPQDRVLDHGCLTYHDLDHLADCGERRMAQLLARMQHPLMALVSAPSDPLPADPAPAAAAAR